MSQTAANFRQSPFMSDAILKDLTSTGNAPNNLVANVARSGQLGTGIRLTKLDAATPAVFNPVVGVVLSMPSMWLARPKMQEMGRSIFETHVKAFTGIDFGYETETADTIVGHDGQTLKVPTRTTRSAVNPSITVQEYTGMPIYNFFKTWLFDMQHPDTNASIIPANSTGTDPMGDIDTSEIPAWVVSAYSMSMLFIQYDPTGLPDRIYDAYIITNMFPTSIGEIGFERTIGTTQIKERSISLTGLVQHNENTRELGYRVAEMLAMHRINYNFALPGMGGSVEVDKAIQSNLRPYGGLEFEGYGDRDTVDGAVQQFIFKGGSSDEGNDPYTDMLNPEEKAFEPSGAAAPNPATNGTAGGATNV